MDQPLNTPPALTERGTTVCRGCMNPSLVSVLDLGCQPLANEMAMSQDVPDPAFPLHLTICSSCGLGQVGEYVLPERIFGRDYPYLSSVSTSWVAHAGAYAVGMRQALGLTDRDLVVEIASNDGYLLEQMQMMGLRVLGVEPAGNVADLARAKGVPTISEFFGLEVARRVVADHGHPRLVAANNVMAHVPDLQDFVAGLAALCDDRTIVTVENPSFLNLLRRAQFDTIYHEHFSYLSAHAVSRLVEPFGLRLVRVEALSTHGGSNRYWLSLSRASRVETSVDRAVEEEIEGGLLSTDLRRDFAKRSGMAIDGLRAWLHTQKAAGQTLVGYGAAAKGNTLMNAAGVRHDDLVAIVDGSPAKQGKFLPGSQVPVVAPELLPSFDPDAVLILPWNLAEEVVPFIADMAPRATPWIAVPAMQALAP